MSQTFVVLGRQPALGLAELESLYGADALHPTTQRPIALLDVAVELPRLGGTIKCGVVFTELPTTNFKEVIAHVAEKLPQLASSRPDGKIRLGLNAYGFSLTSAELNRAGLQLKKAIKNTGRNVRVVPNTELELSSAQTVHNQLTGPTGIELLFARNGASTVIGQVTHVQDIAAYTARDQVRPKRDARVGMLPPKLAQIIVNLSVHSDTAMSPEQQAKVTKEARLSRLLDPFCGTGVILQEALLKGFDVIGTDLEPRMISFSRQNLDWLQERLSVAGSFELKTVDATDGDWPAFDVVASETYLGRPFNALPNPEVFKQVVGDVNTITKKFLKNLARQTKSGQTACLAVPAWQTNDRFKHLPTLDSLEELGYTRTSFAHARTEDLIYHREGQIVARELVVLTRK